MLNISTNQPYITLITVFVVQPSDQTKLLNTLTLTTQKYIRKLPGFLSSALHRSIDGTKVTMYAQWESLEHYQQMHNHPQVFAQLSEAMKYAKFEPAVYEVFELFQPE